MLFERRTLLIVPKFNDQIPIFQAIHSLIYPFEFCLPLPCLKYDTSEEQDYFFEDIISADNPLDQFICICQEDKEKAFEILCQDDRASNILIIDVCSVTQTTHEIASALAFNM